MGLWKPGLESGSQVLEWGQPWRVSRRGGNSQTSECD